MTPKSGSSKQFPNPTLSLFVVPPSLDTRGVNAAVRAVAGDRVKFCFPCAGEPAPEIRWVREGDGAEGAEQGAIQ